MTEPDVALTDYGLFVLNGGFAVVIAMKRRDLLRWPWVLFFGSLSIASLFGGTVHGFFLNEMTAGYQVLWPLTLIFIGTAAIGAWRIGAHLYPLRETVRGQLNLAVTCAFVLYAALVYWGADAFWVAVLFYLPGVIFLTLASYKVLARDRSNPARFLFAGLLLTFVAAAIQQFKIGIHPHWFNYNATYHVVQAVALVMIFKKASLTEHLSNERNRT